MEELFSHYMEAIAILLFAIGFSILLFNKNLIKKIMGLNIMDSGMYLLLASIGYIDGLKAPIGGASESADASLFVNPIPAGLVLTGIVVSVSVTAIMLALTIRLYARYHTLNLDEIFEKIVACIRIAVPYTGMIISTRESQEVREKMLHLGVSQISGASRTSVGGYTEEERPHDSEQFDVSDQRTLDEVVNWLMELGYIPSFCTACYREGRTGDRFMSLCKTGQIQNCCHPNALMTLCEFLVDYASEDTKKIGFDLIEKELNKIPNAKAQQIARDNVDAIKSSNRRDFRF